MKKLIFRSFLMLGVVSFVCSGLYGTNKEDKNIKIMKDYLEKKTKLKITLKIDDKYLIKGIFRDHFKNTLKDIEDKLKPKEGKQKYVHLDCSNTKITGDKLIKILDAIEKAGALVRGIDLTGCKNLRWDTALSLFGTSMEKKLLKGGIPVLRRKFFWERILDCAYMQELIVANSNLHAVRPDLWMYFFDGLKKLKLLKKLDVSRNNLDFRSMRFLTTKLEEFKELTDLKLGHNDFSKLDEKSFGEKVGKIRYLESLDLTNCRLGKKMFSLIKAFVESKKKNFILKRLYLKNNLNNNISLANAEEFFSNLAKITSLEVLNLKNNKLFFEEIPVMIHPQMPTYGHWRKARPLVQQEEEKEKVKHEKIIKDKQRYFDDLVKKLKNLKKLNLIGTYDPKSPVYTEWLYKLYDKLQGKMIYYEEAEKKEGFFQKRFGAIKDFWGDVKSEAKDLFKYEFSSDQ